MASTHFLVVAAAMLTVASLGAQTPPVGGAAAPVGGAAAPVGGAAAVPGSSRIEERSQAMREKIGSGKQLQSHVRVAVRLKNGNRLKGVVKDGKLVERVDGLRFVDAQAQEIGAGIRLWYSGGARNYVFVPFDGLAEYQVLQRLTPEQLETIENEMQLAETKRAERLRLATEAQQAEARAAKGEGAEAPAGQEPTPATADQPAAGAKYETPQRRAANKAKAEAEAKAKELEEGKVEAAAEQATHKAWFVLLQEYPPAAGWNQAKRDEIARRKVVIGALPSEKEQRFVDKFEDWKKACAHFGPATETKQAEAGADGTGTEPATESEDTGKKSRRKKS